VVGCVVQTGHGGTVRTSPGGERMGRRRLGGAGLRCVSDRDRVAVAARHAADRALGVAACLQSVDGGAADPRSGGAPDRPGAALADAGTAVLSRRGLVAWGPRVGR